jgi:hypothetical protein
VVGRSKVVFNTPRNELLRSFILKLMRATMFGNGNSRFWELDDANFHSLFLYRSRSLSPSKVVESSRMSEQLLCHD